jgi:uncharacterized membrane protein
MARYIVGYAAAAITMAVLDLAWLRFAARTLFEPAAGSRVG